MDADGCSEIAGSPQVGTCDENDIYPNFFKFFAFILKKASGYLLQLPFLSTFPFYFLVFILFSL